MAASASRLELFRPPYRRLTRVDDPKDPLAEVEDLRGAVLAWTMAPRFDGHVFEAVRSRPGGVPLVVVLPPAEELERTDDVLRVVEMCRPHSVLPHHDRLDPGDVRRVLTRAPADLAMEIGDYLAWRGVMLDMDTRRIVRKIAELSAELRTVSALARSLYLSRRALGRRFMKRGLPVPSHWLQTCRLLRAVIRLQASKDNVFVVAAGMGYPDGFSLSNQMKRLTGARPTDAKERLGWEWVFEAWLQKEARDGGFSPEWAPLFLDTPLRSWEGGDSEDGGTTASNGIDGEKSAREDDTRCGYEPQTTAASS